jgi:endonuclease-3 related protein
MSTSDNLSELYNVLLSAYGHRAWWPGETPFEVMVGAILTQRTNWRNVEKAILNLKEADVLSPQALAESDLVRLQGLIRSAGYYRQKAARVRRLAEWVMERCGGDLEGLGDIATEDLRADLLSVRGIGPETADSIMLYALERPVFVVDAYTKRIVVRHGLLDPECGYYELKDLFEFALPADVDLFKDYHAHLVEVGKRHCRPRPTCRGCPVRRLLGEPLEEYC